MGLWVLVPGPAARPSSALPLNRMSSPYVNQGFCLSPAFGDINDGKAYPPHLQRRAYQSLCLSSCTSSGRSRLSPPFALCPVGPLCRYRHVHQVLCPNYFTGFCPKGPKCQLGQ